MLRRTTAILLCVTIVALAPALLHAQGGPPPRVRAVIDAVLAMLTVSDESALDRFAAEQLDPAYVRSFPPDSLRRHLAGLRTAAGGAVGGVRVERDDAGLLLQLDGRRPAALRIVLNDADRITRIELAPQVHRASPWTGVTWETLDATVSRAAEAGFRGAILARRNGAEVLRTAVGNVDTVPSTPITPATVFGIGSTPIDFTITGIMLLGQRGLLALDDSIGRYLPDVPADRRGITIRHLLTGRSGLPDFFHLDGEDWDADLAWIPRAEAERRLMAVPLRFAPGTARAASHAAFGLLAAIIERVGGRPYPVFVREEILVPLGMTRTAFYGENLGLGLADFAVGSGPSSVGLPNIPPNWGPTSWLIMGSGGMASTLDDMDRYYTAIRNGTLLRGEWAAFQRGPSAGAGGSDRGFYIHHVTDGKGTSILLLTNTDGRTRNTPALVDAIESLVLPRSERDRR